MVYGMLFISGISHGLASLNQILFDVASKKPGIAFEGLPNDPAVSQGLGSIGSLLIMIVPLVLVFYFMMIRPQSKQKKARALMMKNLKVGDRVRTIGMMFGRVAEIKDNTVTIETGRDKVRLVFDRSAISTVEGGADDTNADLQ
jgi:preprotein translocase subunit YajC